MDHDLQQLQLDYLTHVRETIERLRAEAERLRGRDNFKTAFPSLLFLAHQLKGSATALGYPRISEVGRQIGDTLSLFLDETGAPRPTPAQLSDSVMALSNQLEREVEISKA